MRNDIELAFDYFMRVPQPPPLPVGTQLRGQGPTRLASRFSQPASVDEIKHAWPDGQLPSELTLAWRRSRESWLFEDTNYGQWGLHLLAPQDCAAITRRELVGRPEDYRSDEIVIAEFLGDSDLLVMSPNATGGAKILIALPLYFREDWPVAASSLSEFLNLYREAEGMMFWE